MVRSDPKIRKRTKSNGGKKDAPDKTETFRGYSEDQSFIGSRTRTTIKQTDDRIPRRKK